MDNRRPTGASPEKTFSRGSYYKKNGENSNGQRNFQPRDNRFQSRDERYPPRRDQDKFGARDEKAPRREGRFQPRDDNRFQPRGERFQPREERFQQNRDGKFQPREGGRFVRRDDRADNRNGRFEPRKNFVPRGAKPLPPWKRVEKPRIYDEMQITDGKHIGKFLKSTDSPKVRPTARRVRETMFKIIFRRVRAGRFLDLCAGSGAVGIEAISRGALIGSFVERSAKMCSFIKKNLEACGIKEGHGEIFNMEIVPFLKQMSKRRRYWDVVFYDPPYDTNYDEVLSYLSRGVCIKPRGALIIEHHAEMFFPEKLGVLHRWRVIVMGETALSFYERK
jgi:16S rRNA (guanine966-N2)-methyltransferase